MRGKVTTNLCSLDDGLSIADILKQHPFPAEELVIEVEYDYDSSNVYLNRVRLENDEEYAARLAKEEEIERAIAEKARKARETKLKKAREKLELTKTEELAELARLQAKYGNML